jgi:hypothetical protein
MRRGMSNKEIGRRLGISDMTVKTHAHNIFHKLEISGRMHLFGLPRAQQIAAPLEPRLPEISLTGSSAVRRSGVNAGCMAMDVASHADLQKIIHPNRPPPDRAERRRCVHQV